MTCQLKNLICQLIDYYVLASITAGNVLFSFFTSLNMWHISSKDTITRVEVLIVVGFKWI